MLTGRFKKMIPPLPRGDFYFQSCMPGLPEERESRKMKGIRHE